MTDTPREFVEMEALGWLSEIFIDISFNLVSFVKFIPTSHEFDVAT